MQAAWQDRRSAGRHPGGIERRIATTAQRPRTEESVRVYEFAQVPDGAWVEAGRVEVSRVNTGKRWPGAEMAVATRALLQRQALALGASAVIVKSFLRNGIRESASGIAIRLLAPAR